MAHQVLTYIIEQNCLIREGLKSFLTDTDFLVAKEYTSLKNIVSLPANTQPCPDLVIIGLDQDFSLSMQDRDDPPLLFRKHIQETKNLFQTAKIVALLSTSQESSLYEIWSSDIDGYILRTIGSKALLNYLNLAMMGEKVIHDTFPGTMFGSYPRALKPLHQHHMNGSSGHSLLSQRETDIIKCLVSGESNKVIARRLGITEATVKVHLKTILRKLGLHNRTQVALWAVNNGYSDLPDVVAVQQNMFNGRDRDAYS